MRIRTPRTGLLLMALAAFTWACEPEPGDLAVESPESLGAAPAGDGPAGPPRGGRRGDGDAPPPPPPEGEPEQRDAPEPPPEEQPPEPAEPEPVDEPAEPEPVDEPAEPEPVDEPLPEPPEPADDGFEPPLALSPRANPITSEKVELGRLLYWDPILSGHNDVACATCHHPDFGYADGLPLSVGVGGRGLGTDRVRARGTDFAGRNAPTTLLTGLNGWVDPNRMPPPEQAPMFWDLRERSLEAQALGPLLNAIEMRGDAYSEADTFGIIEDRLTALPEYVELFAEAFDVPADEAVTIERVAQAIAAFERHLSRPSSAFDRFTAGERNALNPQQVRGLNALRTVGCVACHGGPMFSDYRPHRIGAPDTDGAFNDAGDGAFRFRTQTLRNVAVTGPYMHGGAFDSLEEVMDFYQRAGRPAPGAAPTPRGIGPLDPAFARQRFNNGQAADMVAFLEALTDEDVDVEMPASVPSGLPVGGLLD